MTASELGPPRLAQSAHPQPICFGVTEDLLPDRILFR